MECAGKVLQYGRSPGTKSLEGMLSGYLSRSSDNGKILLRLLDKHILAATISFRAKAAKYYDLTC